MRLYSFIARKTFTVAHTVGEFAFMSAWEAPQPLAEFMFDTSAATTHGKLRQSAFFVDKTKPIPSER